MNDILLIFCCLLLLFQLIRQLPNLNEKCKELPLCRMYSVKARAILHAHLSRIDLNVDTLDKDRQIIVQKCPYLIQEMVSCVNQLIMLAYARRSKYLPSIEKHIDIKFLINFYSLQSRNCQALKLLKIV